MNCLLMLVVAMGSWYWLRCSPYFRVFNPEIQLKKFDEDISWIN
jgi:deoxyribodipyrimidine photolyase